MKIAFVCHDASLTGAPKIGFELARFLSRDNEIIMLLKTGGPLANFPDYNSAFDKIIITNTSHEDLKYNFSERILIAKNILQEQKPDILYVNSVASSDWCRAGKECKIPVVLHSHEMRNELLSLASVDIFKTDLPKYVDLLITVSPEAEKDIVKECGSPFKKIFSSRPGIQFATVEKLASYETFDAPRNINGDAMETFSPVISMCGIASRRKGSDIFFRLAKTLPQFNFLWIGPWDKAQAAGNIAFDEYKLTRLDNFYTTGETSNPYPYFKLTDIFVLTSREDPNPLVVMEAVLLSKLCIGFSATGGSRHVLNKYGILLHGQISVDWLSSTIRKIDLSGLTPFLSDERKLKFKEDYDFETIAQTIKMEISSLLKHAVISQ